MAIGNPEALDLAPWANLGFSLVDPNVIVAPDGTLTGDRVKVDTGGGTGVCARFQSQTILSGVPHHAAIFAHVDLTNILAIAEGSFDTSGSLSYFDISNNLVLSAHPNHSDVIIEDYGNGWRRASINYTSITDVIGNFRFYVAESDGDITLVRDGSFSVYMWGAVVGPGPLGPYTSVAGHLVEPISAAAGQSYPVRSLAKPLAFSPIHQITGED